VASTLPRFPRANACLTEGRVKVHRQIRIGVGLGIAGRLGVIVIGDVHLKTGAQVAHELAALSRRAEEKALGAQDRMGSTFLIYDLSAYGIERVAAAMVPSQITVLSVGRTASTGGAPGPSLCLTLNTDQRCLDAVQGALFLADVRRCLEEPHLLL
jgi:pyruvate/2-oxoglutarate dehydrogenase complex dihydrolipoamide acyltransferase (E2) component